MREFEKPSVVKGKLQGHKRGYAFLIREDGNPDVFIPNRKLEGAVHGDIVIAKVDADGGEVIKIVERGILRIVGTLYSEDGRYFVAPTDESYFRRINVRSAKRTLTFNDCGSKVVVNINPDVKARGIWGEVDEIIGKADDPMSEPLSILYFYEFFDKFNAEAERLAASMVYTPDEGRLDLRDLLTITIDGDDAKDFDDAISIEETKAGFKLYVHIADVSHYVKRGDPIDKEAVLRATSVYFPCGVFPMLPASISNGVCSLNPNEDKLTLSVIMDIDMEGNVTNADFKKTVIRSDYRMTYQNVTKILNGDNEMIGRYMPIVNMLNSANKLKEILHKKRKAEGSIDFVTTESKITLNNGLVTNIEPYPYETSNEIIEHFMILANQMVAKYISDKHFPNVYRVHKQPEPTKLYDFVKLAGAFGYKVEQGAKLSPMDFSNLLTKVKGLPIEPIVSKLMLKTMQKAKYATKNEGHFGLSLEYYCHFTSPIRRYPDLVVHRILKSIMENDNSLKEDKFKGYLDKTAYHCSEREIASEKAERDVDDYYKASFISTKIGEEFDGIVSGVIALGIFVSLENTVEGFIHIRNLPKDFYKLNQNGYQLNGMRNSYSIGDKIRIKVSKVDVGARTIDFLVV